MRCSRCTQEFSGGDQIVVEPSGEHRHSVRCPDLCGECGSRVEYAKGILICRRCGASRKAHLPVLYLIGALKNPRVPEVAQAIRAVGYDVFDDWYAAGPEADDYWQRYEQGRGHSYPQGLAGYPAEHVYSYDRSHLDRAMTGVLLLPAGKSGHLELGYLIGQGKPGYIVFDGKEPERWDVMYKFARGVYFHIDDLLKELARWC